MEFKGTKGEWEVLEYPNDYEVGNLQGDLVCSLPMNTDEYLANAKLISCAPEMLEMLKDILSGMKNENYEVCQKEIEALIKKATTI